jgi:hypothetical protein
VNFPADFRITFPEEFAQLFWLVTSMRKCDAGAAEAVATRRSARSSNTNAGSTRSE